MDKNSFISSADKYLYGLSKLARFNNKTLKDLYLLSIIGVLQDYSCWYELPQEDYDKLEELSQCIILNNTDLDLYEGQTDMYTNVNTPQKIYSWQNVLNNAQNVVTIETNYMKFEDNSYSNQEFEGRINKEPNSNCE